MIGPGSSSGLGGQPVGDTADFLFPRRLGHELREYRLGLVQLALERVHQSLCIFQHLLELDPFGRGVLVVLRACLTLLVMLACAHVWMGDGGPTGRP